MAQNIVVMTLERNLFTFCLVFGRFCLRLISRSKKRINERDKERRRWGETRETLAITRTRPDVSIKRETFGLIEQ